MNRFADSLVGRSPAFTAILNAAEIAAACDVGVLILGETGSGKEMLAQALHAASPRAAKPFVEVNCAALPDALADAELFGHEKGAFTGAESERAGRIAAADGGTLFLDEIGELSLPVQAKLLRFLESGECQVIGGGRHRKVNVRVIAATNRDLQQAVREGRFREDLFYRLNVVPLTLPPLRERGGDVPLLLEHLTAQLAERHNQAAPRFTRDAVKRLEAYGWPGNVRELRNLCERMVVLHAGQTIDAERLPPEFHGANPGGQSDGFSLPAEGVRLDEVEVQLIRQALDRTSGNRSRAARLLGITRDTLLYRLKKYALPA